jgi:hypothetical protein
MQKTVSKKRRRVGKSYRKVVKAAKINKAHRKRMKANRRRKR